MGGYPSHDAPSFLFATAAQHPSDGGTTEVCLVPLLRRYFNDSNKRLKDAVAQLYFKGPPNTSALAMQALLNNIPSHCAPSDISAQASVHNANSLSSSVIAPGGAPSPAQVLNASMTGSASMDVSNETSRRAVHALKAVDQLLSEIEASVLTTTRTLYEWTEEANAKLQEKRSSAIKSSDKGKGHKSRQVSGGALRDDLGPARATANSNRPLSSQQSTAPSPPPVLRPVPCAVCVIEPDTSGRRGSSGQQHTNSPSGIQSNTLSAISVPAPTAGPNGLQIPCYSGASAPSSPEWVTLQGRRLRCVGYLSCFSKPKSVDGEPKDTLGSETKPPLHVLRIGECSPKGLDVALELIFEDETKYTHLLEPVIFLASVMFRSQYLTSSMLQRPVHSPDVENAYYTHLQLLNVHIRLSKEQVHQLKVLQEQLPLIDFVEEMGLSERHSTSGPGGETASCGGGAVSLEATLSVGDMLPEIGLPVAGDGEAPTKADSGTSNPTGVSDGGEVAKLLQSTGGDDAEKPEHLEDDDGEKNGALRALVEEQPVDKTAKKAEEGENEEEEMTESGRNTTAEWDKDAKTNVSLSTSSRRTRRSRRRQRKQKTAEPQDEIYRKTHCVMPSISLYELSSGERGIEAVFDGGLLARMMKLIAETAAYETVKNCFVRCDMGPLMKERRHLNQSRREALQEEGSVEREEERVMGSTIVAATVRRWVKEGLAAEEERRKKAETTAELPQAAPAAASAPQTHAPPLLPPQVSQIMHAPPMMHPNVVQAGAPNMMAGTAASPSMVNPMIAAQAAAMGQNPAMMRMGLVPSNQPPTAAASTSAAPAGGPLFMFVPGFGYMPMPNNSRVLTAPAAQTQAAHPTYVINPATGQPMMLAPQAPPPGSTNTPGTPLQQTPMMAFPSMMHMYNAPQQQQQQQVMAAAQCFAAQGAPPTVQQPQQQAYQYMVSPSGQLVMLPVLSTPTPAAPHHHQQHQQQPQQYMMASMPPQQAQQMQPPQVYMNPYMIPGMMNPAAAAAAAQQQQHQQQQQAQYHAQQQQQQQQQQAEGQKAYQQLIDVQEEVQLLRQLQHQAQMTQQAPLSEQQQAQLLKQAQMMLQARRSQQAQLQQSQQQQQVHNQAQQMAQQQHAQQQAQHQAQQQQAMASMAAGGNPQVFTTHNATGTPANTPPHQGSAVAPPAAYNAAPGSAMPPPPPPPHIQGMQHSNMQNMYAYLQQQQQQPTGNTPVNEAASSGPAPSAPIAIAKTTGTNAGPASGGSAGTIGDHATTLAAVDLRAKTNPYQFAAINDDDDDPSVDLVAAMGNIRGHSDLDDDDDGGGSSRLYANSQLFFST